MNIDHLKDRLTILAKEFNINENEMQKGIDAFLQNISIDSFENTFTQGLVGNKIPLYSEYDFVNEDFDKVLSYMELPHLEHYGAKNLFALRYMGEDVLEEGIKHDSILIFTECEKIDRDGIYAVVSRFSMQFKKALFKNKEIYITPLDNKKRFPKISKTAKANGRLVCVINKH